MIGANPSHLKVISGEAEAVGHRDPDRIGDVAEVRSADDQLLCDDTDPRRMRDGDRDYGPLSIATGPLDVELKRSPNVAGYLDDPRSLGERTDLEKGPVEEL